MKLKILLGAATAIALAAGCATLENLGDAPHTPMMLAGWSHAPEGPYEARRGEHVLTQYLTPRLLVETESIAAPAGGRGADVAPAGAKLFGVVLADETVRYCTTPRDAMMTCLEDSDADGAFDHAWSALGYEGSFALAVRRWTGRRPLASKVGFAPTDPASGPLQQIAIQYVGRGPGDIYGFSIEVGDPARGFASVGGAARTAWVRPVEGVLHIGGAQLELLGASRRGVITYRLGAAMVERPLALQVSNAKTNFGALELAETVAG